MSELRTNRIVPRDGLISGTGIGGGIIQVKSVTKTDTFTTQSTSLVDVPGLSVSITPTRSDSKILISASVTGEGNATDQRRFTHRIKKVISGGATSYIQGATVSNRVSHLGSTGDLTTNATTSASSFSISNYMDAPATTSAVTSVSYTHLTLPTN